MFRYTTEKLNTQYSFETELVIVREGTKVKGIFKATTPLRTHAVRVLGMGAPYGKSLLEIYKKRGCY